MKKKTITISDELFGQFLIFKQAALLFESKLGRTINVIDIIGEIELCNLLKLEMVKDIINSGFDAYDGDLKVQIKATRAKGNNSKLSKLVNLDGIIGFDYILLARYKNNSNLDLTNVYKSSSDSISKYLEYINSNLMVTGRKNKKIYNTISISKFISISDEKYDLLKGKLVLDPNFKNL